MAIALLSGDRDWRAAIDAALSEGGLAMRHGGPGRLVSRGAPGALLADDVMLACQIASPHQPSPETRLLVAVLADGIWAATRVDAAGAKADAIRHEARAWIASDEQSWPCAFLPLCEALGIEPAYLRRGIAEKIAAAERVKIRALGDRAATSLQRCEAL